MLAFAGEGGRGTFSPRPIKKVAVIGGGIAGLSLAHALANSVEGGKDSEAIEVSIFDSRPTFDPSAGAGVQLNGGMAVLGKINPRVQDAVMKAAVPIKNLQGRNKSWFGGTTDRLWDFSIEDIIRSAGGEAEKELIVDSNVMWYSVMRGALQVSLDRVHTSARRFLRNYRGTPNSFVALIGVFDRNAPGRHGANPF